jgi:hypothetical protein
MGWIVTTAHRRDGLWVRYTDGMDCEYDIQMGWIVTMHATNPSHLYVVVPIHPFCLWRSQNPPHLYVVVTIHPVCMLYSQSISSVCRRHTDGMDGDYDVQMGCIVTSKYRWNGLWLRHTDGMDCDYASIPSVCRTYNPSRLYVVLKIHPVCMS